ncbi:MAG TPA: rRNA maturation RNase YbeY [Acholeplasmataceae bacterium]|jgi:probable rRNA maturation factor|nr:rRNA maturation RNase YbeY [Acholeplasmataceae bacterium]HPX71481.1 rRNA maturation RNase YbeY [Acholeplasmataceae bacterium]HQC30587.1 rRNA maturation RNase YbeY [Acholeplasmataceae bacterium]
MKINLFNQTEENIEKYEKVLKRIFKKLKDKKNINIILTNDLEISKLNKTFRNIDSKTDVLSFINDEDLKSNGDIFISLDRVKAQALEYGHSEDREIGFLAVHGYLHLKGYNHETEEEAREMNEVTEFILKEAKLERK